MAAAGIDELLGVEDVGDIIAESVHSYFRNPDNLDIISRLKEAGLQFTANKAKENHSDILEGLTIVISGNFSISRDAMKELITLNGGKNSGSISGKTSYLLAGEKAGPEKLKKAQTLGIKVITEDEFRNMLSDTTLSDNEQNEDNNDSIQLSLF